METSSPAWSFNPVDLVLPYLPEKNTKKSNVLTDAGYRILYLRVQQYQHLCKLYSAHALSAMHIQMTRYYCNIIIIRFSVAFFSDVLFYPQDDIGVYNVPISQISINSIKNKHGLF
uniref:Uncharacterized protein n=1 Tax=Schizaphis graminum TaxID=13262 RepID=A0A2S2P0P1_SCHGA